MELEYVKITAHRVNGYYTCPYNPECRCQRMECYKCGWNPKVDAERRKARTAEADNG